MQYTKLPRCSWGKPRHPPGTLREAKRRTATASGRNHAICYVLRGPPYPTLRELIKENGNIFGLRSVSRRDIERVAPLEKYCGNLPTLLYPSGTPSGEREPLRGTGTSSDFAACPEGTLNGYSARRASPNSNSEWGKPPFCALLHRNAVAYRNAMAPLVPNYSVRRLRYLSISKIATISSIGRGGVRIPFGNSLVNPLGGYINQ